MSEQYCKYCNTAIAGALARSEERKPDAKPPRSARRRLLTRSHRLVPGFVVDTKLEDGARIVTFGNGLVAKELVVDIDEQQKRVSWSAVNTQLTHHNASFQLFDEAGDRTRGVWIADLLPHAAAPNVARMIEEGLAAMKAVFG